MNHTALWSPPDSVSELSDPDLLDLFLQPGGIGQKARSEWAMTRLIERHSPMVLAVCARSLQNRSEAEDAAQAVFLVLWKKAPSLAKTASSLGGWLHRTAVLVCKNANREARNRQTVVRLSQPEPIPFRITDDINASATAYVLPLDHPFVAITDAQGRFRISHLPVGTHHLRVWHERFGYIERDWIVEVVGQTTTKLSPLRVKASKLK